MTTPFCGLWKWMRDTGLTSGVGMYPMIAPPGASYPCMTYQLIGRRAERWLYQVTCWSASRREAARTLRAMAGLWSRCPLFAVEPAGGVVRLAAMADESAAEDESPLYGACLEINIVEP